MEPNNETGNGGEVKLKNVAIFGFAFTIEVALAAIKYTGNTADQQLFRNHKVTIICLQYFMLVAVCVSTTVKLHQALLSDWARLALSRASIFCVFQVFFMLQSIVLFHETPRVWFVVCIFPIIFLPIPLKQLMERGRFCRSPGKTIKLAFEGLCSWVQSAWRTVKKAFERLLNHFLGGDEHPNRTNLPMSVRPDSPQPWIPRDCPRKNCIWTACEASCMSVGRTVNPTAQTQSSFEV